MDCRVKPGNDECGCLKPIGKCLERHESAFFWGAQSMSAPEAAGVLRCRELTKVVTD